MSQSSGQFSGQFTSYGEGSYGSYGHAITPTGTILFNPTKRSFNDRKFYWEASDVYQFTIPSTGTTTGGKFELTPVETYEFAITPDLGWYITEDLFNPYNPSNPYRSNSHLILKSNLSIDNGNISYQTSFDKLYIELSEDDMQRLLYLNFGTYLWSVRGRTKEGVLTPWSAPRRFVGYYKIPDSFVTVDERIKTVNKRTVTLKGSKNTVVNSIVINSITGLARYPSLTSWEFDVLLTGGINTFYIKGITSENIETPLTTSTIILSTGTPALQSLYNTFDDFAAIVGAERLPYESNASFKDRIKDVFVHPSESNLLGLTNSIARNLDTNYSDQALIIRPKVIDGNRRSDELYPNLFVEIDVNSVFAGSQSFYIHNEYHRVDPQDWSIVLNGKLNTSTNDVKVYSPPGNLIDSRQYYLVDNKIKFVNNNLKEVWVTYNFKIEIDKSSSKTIYDIYTGINNITYNNRAIFTVTTGTVTGSADGLLKGKYSIKGLSKYIDEDDNVQYGVPIKWADFSINELVNTNYQNRYTGEFGDLLNSKIESFVNTFKSKSHISYGQLICDVDILDPIDEDTETSSYLPSSLNPTKGYWKSTDPNDSNKFSTTQAIEMDFISAKDKAQMQFYGIKSSQFKSGIGDKDDLKVVISDYTVKEDIVKPDVFRATIGFETTGQTEDALILPDTVWGSILFES